MVSFGTGPGRRQSTGPPEDSSCGLADAAVAMHLALESCREIADGETAAMLSAAIAPLDDLARYGDLLSPADQRQLLDELRDVEDMVEVILDQLRERRARGQPAPPTTRR